QDWIAELIGLLPEKFWVLPIAMIAWDHGYTGLLHQRLGAVLQAHRSNGFGRWTYKNHGSLCTGLRKIRVLGQKAVTRMDTLGTRRFCHPEQLLDQKIALRRWRRAYGVRLVAQPHMQSVSVSLRIDRDGA